MSNLSPNLFGEYLEPEPSKPVGRPGRKSGNTGRRSGDIPMFLPADEIKKYITSATDSYAYEDGHDINNVWKRKLEESKFPTHYPSGSPTYVHGAGVFESIKEHGFDWDHPVEIHHEADGGNRILGEGHHRVAAGDAVQEETGKDVWIPINHNFLPKDFPKWQDRPEPMKLEPPPFG